MKRFLFALSVATVAGLLATPGSAYAQIKWGSCANCGSIIGDTCRHYYGDVQTGTYYSLQNECHIANGPKDCRKLCCDLSITGKKTKKYSLEGSISYEIFGLKAGYDKEEVTEISTKCDGCIEKPSQQVDLWLYYKYDYVQKWKSKRNDTTGVWCVPCNNTDNTDIGTLKTYSNPSCESSNKHQPSPYSPPLKTIADLCKQWGAPS